MAASVQPIHRDSESPDEALAPSPAPAPAPPSRRRLVLALLAVALVVGGSTMWLLTHGRESTDDAQVDAEVVPVPAQYGGVVQKLHFVDNQAVKAGDLLAELDDAQPKAKLAQAEATLLAAVAQADASEAQAALAERNAVGNQSASRATLAGAAVGTKTSSQQLKEGEAQLASARVSLAQATQDRDRAKALAAKGAASQAQLDQAETQYRLAESAVQLAMTRIETLRVSVSAAQSRLDEASARAAQASDVPSAVKQARAQASAARAQVDVARAQRDIAALDLEHTRIRAPQAGVVSKKAISVGQQVVAGQAIVQLVTEERWITANFKETQVAAMKVGQPVKVSIDAYGGKSLQGKLESFSGATGSRFTLLPPDNATGNFTKVVQRVPVRVQLTVDAATGKQLRPGMNAEITVDTRE